MVTRGGIHMSFLILGVLIFFTLTTANHLLNVKVKSQANNETN